MKKWYSLIDKIYRKENLELAFRKVKRNHGAPGIDGETVLDFNEALETNIEFLHEKLKTNTYEPDPVRRVEIEKPDGGIRLLGVPTVKDRVVQQAIVNIIEPIYEPTFHPSSYGYRPNHSPQQAVAKAERFMNRYELTEVVDMDLSKCFDTLDHEILMRAVAERISDGKVLGLLRKFLKSGVMQSDRFIETEIGSCQGGVISPLLSNIYLNQFDQKMKGKGLRIVRYADDILIFAKDKQTAGNYKAYATKVLEEELKLKVNETKTRLTSVREGVTFLGFVIYAKYLVINPKRIKRFKGKIRNITRRNAGRPLEKVIKELNPVLRGWLNYYRIANIKSLITEMMSWIRRRLRMIKMKQWKTYKAMHKEMRKQGIKGSGEKMAVTKWKNSNVHIIHMLLPNQYFEDLGLIDLGQYKVGLLSNYY
ncbi:group II intron reverse transcriptase/maturase [Acetobacterium sp. K1/6]|uniref:group II intron reverse transcriptase/maturase n=1 Tax=Acetobacterium sp. K1/6 TaxID=3055467 RepID=UPI002ACAF427|nr:group II intron reverse transcriptase/maturase [Acetobacterium sp. K1/6]MDZ5724069.1 group II intron reverse transcriptase/maturase [Acetobacterium sp. K1/6]MDZ5724201.1 group II intron reverse transcriptase/maturase [Acetobacterium sp. K1/6]